MKRPDYFPDLPEGYAWRHHAQRERWEIVTSPLGRSIAFITDSFIEGVLPMYRDMALKGMVRGLPA